MAIKEARTRLAMLEQKVFVVKLGSVNGFSACSIPSGEITTLNHELGNNTVEYATLEVTNPR